MFLMSYPFSAVMVSVYSSDTLSHWNYAEQRSEHFIGMTDDIEQILAFCCGDSKGTCGKK